MNNEELINIAISKMSTISDPEHFLGHTLDVVDYAKELLQDIDADYDISLIACYWHDVGRTEIQKGHEQRSGEMLREEMRRLNYSEDMIDKCYNAVIYHKWNAKPITVEGNIVRDSDKLAFLGKRRWDNCEKNNYSLASIVEALPHLRNEYLYFDESRIIYDRDINEVEKRLNKKIKSL